MSEPAARAGRNAGAWARRPRLMVAHAAACRRLTSSRCWLRGRADRRRHRRVQRMVTRRRSRRSGGCPRRAAQGVSQRDGNCWPRCRRRFHTGRSGGLVHPLRADRSDPHRGPEHRARGRGSRSRARPPHRHDGGAAFRAGTGALVAGFRLLRTDPEEAGRRADAASEAVHPSSATTVRRWPNCWQSDDLRAVLAGQVLYRRYLDVATRSSRSPTGCGSPSYAAHERPRKPTAS